MRRCIGIITGLALGAPLSAAAQPSVARQWNEVLLEAIRGDSARPTVHARNLFHTSVAMYDAWAVYDDVAKPYLLNATFGDFACPFYGVPDPPDREAARVEAMSYAAYRLLSHRFAQSQTADSTLARFDSLFAALGYDGLGDDHGLSLRRAGCARQPHRPVPHPVRPERRSERGGQVREPPLRTAEPAARTGFVRQPRPSWT